MKVSELIEILKTKDQDLTVVVRVCSDYYSPEPDTIHELLACYARADGWVECNSRTDKDKTTYLAIHA